MAAQFCHIFMYLYNKNILEYAQILVARGASGRFIIFHIEGHSTKKVQCCKKVFCQKLSSKIGFKFCLKIEPSVPRTPTLKRLLILFLQKMHSFAFVNIVSKNSKIYIIINVLDGIGRAIARWNHLAIKMIMSWEIFASQCVFLLHKATLNGRFEACIANMNCRQYQKIDFPIIVNCYMCALRPQCATFLSFST